MINYFYTEMAAAFPSYAASPNESMADELSSTSVIEEGGLPSWFAVTDLAVASIATAGLMLARLASKNGGNLPSRTVDRRLASFWFKTTLRPVGWTLPPIWNAVSGNYLTQDGWIRLHTNVSAHRAAALSVLGASEDREAVAKAVAGWSGVALMDAIVEAGGCAAAMNNIDEWRHHPQGAAVAQEPLIQWVEHETGNHSTQPLDQARPLAGIRILDLTRILAGPISTRFLAAYGADVLRIDPPGWDEPANIPEVVLGKRCAGLDLRQEEDQATFTKLLQGADVLVHGYRHGALAGLGFDAEARRTINPNLIDVSLNAYGWTGPWTMRRGFDSLVQMNSGIADFGMKQERSDTPFPLPAQALDHATGYLMAAAVLCALERRHVAGIVTSARLSLARTAAMLIPTHSSKKSEAMSPETAADLAPAIEKSAWGDAQRIRFPLKVEGIDAKWPHPAGKLRTAEPAWQQV